MDDLKALGFFLLIILGPAIVLKGCYETMASKGGTSVGWRISNMVPVRLGDNCVVTPRARYPGEEEFEKYYKGVVVDICRQGWQDSFFEQAAGFRKKGVP